MVSGKARCRRDIDSCPSDLWVAYQKGPKGARTLKKRSKNQSTAKEEQNSLIDGRFPGGSGYYSAPRGILVGKGGNIIGVR